MIRIIRHIALAMALLLLPPEAHAEEKPWTGATGGILRLPNSNQAHDDGNAFGEAWGKIDRTLHRTEKDRMTVFVLGNAVTDSAGYGYNSTSKIGIGLAWSRQVSPELNLTFSLRHDWARERDTDLQQNGVRAAIDYYFYRYREGEPDQRMWGLPVRGTILKSYGTLAYPGSLQPGDRNLVLTAGGELSRDLALGKTKLLLSPFLDVDMAWDLDGNDYNNKLVLGGGVKLRRPLPTGELFAAARVQSDYRWQQDHDRLTVRPGLHLGWYVGF